MTYRLGMSDTKEWIVEGFKEGIASLPDELLSDLLPEKALEYGKRAARVAIAPVAWSQAVGARLDTNQAVDLLGITRQALHKRVRTGSLIGIPGRGTTYFPAWQFNSSRNEVWPVVRHIIGVFAEELGERVDPMIIAAWATTRQYEDLDGSTPAEWIAVKHGEYPEEVLESARRAAGRLAR
jgi:hypothetical protein